MKIAFTTTFNSSDVNNWSGTPFYMSKSFVEQGIEVERIGNLQRKLPYHFKINQFWKKLVSGQRESPRFNIVAAKNYSKQVAEQLKTLSVDAIVSPLINPIAYLDSKKPILLWTDALYSSLVGFYPVFGNHSTSSIKQGNIITRECLARCKFAIFSSEWAARSATELYGINKEKVKVIPYGANINCHYTVDDIRAMLKMRSKEKVKLLFIGKHWDRKGGDIVFNVAKALHAAGQPVELNFVGCHPPAGIEIPSYIRCHGFISKRSVEGIAKLTQLFQESHFLFVPTRAEAYGIVFCEANAFGLPCLTSHVGGVSTIIHNNVNGMSFALESSSEIYCEYITKLMQNYSQYEALALSSFNEYQTRLNWKVAIEKVKDLLRDS